MSQNNAASTRTLTSPSPVNSVHLPFDLVSDILCRLSVKQLFQLCCVCKSWNSLISFDSNFTKKQLSFSTFNKNRHHLFLSSTSGISRKFLVCHSPISSFFSPASIVTVKHLSQTITGFLDNELTRLYITTCDGILCFEIDEYSAVLYNPSIGKSKILPPLKNAKYTLVYDRITSNYKIVAIVTLSDSREKQVYIHTLGTDYWTRIQDLPYRSLYSELGIFVSDTINWLAYDISLPYVKVIVSLHLEKESYQKLSPPLYDTGYEVSVAMGALRDCLSILSCRDKFYNVWIMKEHGNEKSWTKFFSIPRTKVGKDDFYFFVKVLYISEDDQLLMMEFKNTGGYGLIVYDSTKNTFSIPKMQNNIHDRNVAPHFYVESLVSPF